MMMQQVPPWLEALLTTRFFSTCGAHAGFPRSERNKFCLDCRAPPPAFCYYCRQQTHAAHRVIQIRRSSYHDVVRVAEVEDALDVAGVQTYVINGARVLFLNERPQPTPRGTPANARGGGTTYSCHVCGRALLDTFRFCSLGCKLVSIKRSGAGVEEGAGSDDVVDSGSNAIASGGGRQQHLAPTMAPVRKHHRRHRRKGIPRRAPLGSFSS